MNLTRTLKHLFYPGWWLRRDFPAHELANIEAAIKTSESKHSGEIRFAIESSLPLRALWNDESPKERALEVFSLLKVWDTEDNNGVLIYLLLADHKVEITADRNINKVVGLKEWQRICKIMETDFKAGRFGDGAVKGIEEIGILLEKHFPIGANNKNELSNKPVIL
ncbi:MAG: TPM domain-containing protein [Cocleimonas sp.]|nr:TPM domain-containing protein [Cocleimonas sp.]